MKDVVLVDKEDFIYHMFSTSDYSADEIELFADGHFQNLISLDANVENFIKWAEQE